MEAINEVDEDMHDSASASERTPKPKPNQPNRDRAVHKGASEEFYSKPNLEAPKAADLKFKRE